MYAPEGILKVWVAKALSCFQLSRILLEKFVVFFGQSCWSNVWMNNDEHLEETANKSRTVINSWVFTKFDSLSIIPDFFPAIFRTTIFYVCQKFWRDNKKKMCVIWFSIAETALLLPAELSKSRHENDTVDIRRNLRLRYRDTFKHNRDHEWVSSILIFFFGEFQLLPCKTIKKREHNWNIFLAQ